MHQTWRKKWIKYCQWLSVFYQEEVPVGKWYLLLMQARNDKSYLTHTNICQKLSELFRVYDQCVFALWHEYGIAPQDLFLE